MWRKSCTWQTTQTSFVNMSAPLALFEASVTELVGRNWPVCLTLATTGTKMISLNLIRDGRICCDITLFDVNNHTTFIEVFETKPRSNAGLSNVHILPNTLAAATEQEER